MFHSASGPTKVGMALALVFLNRHGFSAPLFQRARYFEGLVLAYQKLLKKAKLYR